MGLINNWWNSLWSPKVIKKRPIKTLKFNVGSISLLLSYLDLRGNVKKHLGYFTGNCEWSNAHESRDINNDWHQGIKRTTAASLFDDFLESSNKLGFFTLEDDAENKFKLIPKERVLELFITEKEYIVTVHYGTKEECEILDNNEIV